jgi:hypothetical protein
MGRIWPELASFDRQAVAESMISVPSCVKKQPFGAAVLPPEQQASSSFHWFAAVRKPWQKNHFLTRREWRDNSRNETSNTVMNDQSKIS